MSSDIKILNHLPALKNQITRVALEAGAKTLEFFEETGTSSEVLEKQDGSPVTLADQEAEKIIESALCDITPSVPILGEEAVAENRIADIQGHEYFWLVDPLDGTKEFISGKGEFTVNIALIKGSEPVMGVVYAPYMGELYASAGPGTATRWLEETESEKTIHARSAPKEGVTVIGSRRHGDNEKMDAFLSSFKVAKFIKRGSSLKICAVAAGKADIYPRFGPTCEWDTAAADAVLRASGGIMVHADTKSPLVYGKVTEKFYNPEFIAISDPALLQE